MQTSKKWVKVDSSIFTLWDNNKEIGTMEIALGSFEREATAKINGRSIVIRKTGFWKSNLEITDSNKQIIAKVYSEKWYANYFIVEYDNKKYKLIVRNNPLAEWALQNNDEDLLAYGLDTQDSKPCIKITTSSVKPDYIFDFILWYLFLPIATEQSADDLTFLMLIA